MLNEERREEVLFPHENVRPIQDEMIMSVERCLDKKKHLVVHAPTGLGKTAATIGPAVAHALEHDLTVFFLTSRHTQHRIALETVAAMEERYDITVPVSNLIGKKWMCLQPGAEKLYSGEFVEYCRKLREDGECSYYENLKKNGGLSMDARTALAKAIKKPGSKKLKVIGQDHHVCPYEIGVLAAQKAKVVVTDYYYIFNPGIRDMFFQKTSKDLSKSIVIVDEAHNLPDRIKDLASQRTSVNILKRAVKEASDWGYDAPALGELQEALRELVGGVEDDGERYVTKDDLLSLVDSPLDIEILLEVGDEIREEEQRSYIGSVADFLESWVEDKEGFTRILTERDDNIVLSHRCLDPGVVSGPVIRESYSTILMSGTLNPTVMYAELLDIPLNCEDYTFQSPFPDENRLSLVVPHTTTKYKARGPDMFQSQARIIARMVDAVPGNTLVFFPSYYLRDKVYEHVQNISKKTLFQEQRGMSKAQREDLLDRFGQYKDSGAALFGVASGSFAEGVDLPGDLVKCVIVVGLPLARPDKEVQALIEYYDEKFDRGWDYGYIFPAFNRVLQSAGRCIRSSSDKGVLVFLDERYGWNNYQRCFPPHWDLQSTSQPDEEIKEFFGVSKGKQETLG